MSLSIVINTKNMASTLALALESVKDWADEVIVVDMNSSDDTVAVAEKFGARIFHYKQDLGFADPARNFGLEKAKSDWIFVLDADEEVTPALKKELIKIMNGDVAPELSADAYFLARKNMIFGKWMKQTGWWPDYQLRFFKKGMVSWSDKVHTAPTSKGKTAQLPVQEELAIIHHNYQSVEQYLDRLNRYTNLEVSDHAQEGRRRSDTFAPADFVKAFGDEFLSRFFVHQGVAEGVHGLNLSLLQALYELTVKLKEWEKQKFPHTSSSAKDSIAAVQSLQHSLQYWIADWHVKNAHGPAQMYWRIRRKLKI